jgi:hypothetical protein
VVREESKVIVGWEKSGRVESEVSTHLFNSFIQCWYFQISRVSDPEKVKTRRVTDPAFSGNGNAGSVTLRLVIGGEVGKGVGKFGG